MANSCFLIPLGPHPALVKLQRELQARLPGMEADEARDFHLTLVFVEDEAGADLRRVPIAAVTPFVIEARRVGSFQAGEDGYPVVLKIDPSPALFELQRRLADACLDAGCAISEYSAPRLYAPHVTMGYGKAHGIADAPLRRPVRLPISVVMLTASVAEDVHLRVAAARLG